MHLQACMNDIGERKHKYFYSFAHRYSSNTCIDPPSSMVNMFYSWLAVVLRSSIVAVLELFALAFFSAASARGQ
jgi:hypothetical protein